MSQGIVNKPCELNSDDGSQSLTISELLDVVENLAPRVKATSDKIDVMIDAVERRLTTVGTATSCSVTIDPNDSASSYDFEPHIFTDLMSEEERTVACVFRSLELWYQRCGVNYRLVLRESVHWHDETSAIHSQTIFEHPLRECSADKKLYCIHFICVLIRQIAVKMKRQADAADILISNGQISLDPPFEDAKPALTEKIVSQPQTSGVRINLWRGVHSEDDVAVISHEDHQRIRELLESNQRGHAAVLLRRLTGLTMNYAKETLDHEKSFLDVNLRS